MPEPIALIFALAMQRPPILDGWATWYGINDGSGNTFRSGEAFRLDAPYCAVDTGQWYELHGRRLYVQTDERFFSCIVADSGWLERAGEHEGRPFVIDMPHDFFVAATGDRATKRVIVFSLDDDVSTDAEMWQNNE